MILQIVLWILATSAIPLFGAWYAKKYDHSDALVALYVLFITFSNLSASKIGAFDLFGITLYAPATILVFAVTFLMTDIVNEKFGRRQTHRMIFIGFVTQVVLSVFSWLALSLTAAPFWTDEKAFMLIFGQVPRIVFASWIAFLVSENLDAWIFDKFKRITNGKYLWLRYIISTPPSMICDSAIFLSIAFWGIAPIWPLFVGQVVLKWLVGILDIPYMYAARRIMRNQGK